MIYTSPKLEHLGTVAGLTASDIKCTPGDDFGWQLHIDTDGVHDPALPLDVAQRLLDGGCITQNNPTFKNLG